MAFGCLVWPAGGAARSGRAPQSVSCAFGQKRAAPHAHDLHATGERGLTYGRAWDGSDLVAFTPLRMKRAYETIPANDKYLLERSLHDEVDQSLTSCKAETERSPTRASYLSRFPQRLENQSCKCAYYALNVYMLPKKTNDDSESMITEHRTITQHSDIERIKNPTQKGHVKTDARQDKTGRGGPTAMKMRPPGSRFSVAAPECISRKPPVVVIVIQSSSAPAMLRRGSPAAQI